MESPWGAPSISDDRKYNVLALFLLRHSHFDGDAIVVGKTDHVGFVGRRDDASTRFAHPGLEGAAIEWGNLDRVVADRRRLPGRSLLEPEARVTRELKPHAAVRIARPLH